MSRDRLNAAQNVRVGLRLFIISVLFLEKACIHSPCLQTMGWNYLPSYQTLELSLAFALFNVSHGLLSFPLCMCSCSITLPAFFRQLSQHCYHEYDYSSIYCNSIHRVISYIWLWFPVTDASMCGPGKGCRCWAVTSNLLCSRWWWLPFTPDSSAITAPFDIHQLFWATMDFTFYISNISLHAAGKSCVKYLKVLGKCMMG